MLKQTVQKPIKPWKDLKRIEKVKGSTIKPSIKSGDFPWLPLMKSNTQPESTLTQLPGDTPHRSTHQTLIPSSPIWLPSKSITRMVRLMRKASAKAWKRCKWSVKQMTRGKTETKNLPKGIQEYDQSGQSDKAAHAFCKHCEKKRLDL